MSNKPGKSRPKRAKAGQNGKGKGSVEPKAARPVKGTEHAGDKASVEHEARRVDGLTALQARFCEEYLVDLNGTDAYIRAGYKVRTRRAAEAAASRMLSNVIILQKIMAGMGERSLRTGIEADRTLMELARVGFATIGDVAQWDERGGLVVKASAEIGADTLAAVAQVKQTSTQYGTNITVKMHPKLPALEMIGRHLRLFTDKFQLVDPSGQPIEGPVGREESMAILARIAPQYLTEEEVGALGGKK